MFSTALQNKDPLVWFQLHPPCHKRKQLQLQPIAAKVHRSLYLLSILSSIPTIFAIMSSTHTSIILSLLQQGNVLNIPNVGTFVWRNCAVAVLSDAEHVADKDTIKQRAIQALTESYTAPAGKYYWKQITLRRKTPKGFRVSVTVPSKWSKKKRL